MSVAWNRVNTLLLLLVLLALLALIGMVASRAWGGPLDPPGPPGSTDGVRQPGTPIASLPFSITQPGYYYVTRPLMAPAGSNGISITSANVTVDLGGFTMEGSGPSSAGVIVTGTRPAIRITNGTIRGFAWGILANAATHSRVDNITVWDAGYLGIDLGGGSVVEDCNVANSYMGIHMRQGIVRDCIVMNIQLSGIVAFDRTEMHDVYVYNTRLAGDSAEASVRFTGFSSHLRDSAVYDIRVDSGYTGNTVVRTAWCGLSQPGGNNIAPKGWFDIGEAADGGISVDPAGHTAPDPRAGAPWC